MIRNNSLLTSQAFHNFFIAFIKGDHKGQDKGQGSKSYL